MFTGIVETTGTLAAVRPMSDGRSFAIDCPFVHELILGESVAVNGACLTVVAVEQGAFLVEAGFETLAKTNLGSLSAGGRVNLERALKFGDRLGGHLVSGHIDAVGAVASRTKRGEFELWQFQVAPEWTAQMVPKGSIAVDGVSLTLIDVESDRFSIMLIPHTLDVTTLGAKTVGDPVNIETDMLGKYVQKQLLGWRDRPPS